MRSMHWPLSCPESGEELIGSACSRNFCEGAPHTSYCVRVASANGNLAYPRGQLGGALIRFRPHLAVPRFKRWHIGGKPAEVLIKPSPRQPREHMIHAEKQFLLGKVHHQRNEVFTPALDFNMVAFSDSVNAQVHLSSTRHLHGRFLAQEEIGMFPESFPGVDGIMVC